MRLPGRSRRARRDRPQKAAPPHSPNRARKRPQFAELRALRARLRLRGSPAGTRATEIPGMCGRPAETPRPGLRAPLARGRVAAARGAVFPGEPFRGSLGSERESERESAARCHSESRGSLAEHLAGRPPCSVLLPASASTRALPEETKRASSRVALARAPGPAFLARPTARRRQQVSCARVLRACHSNGSPGSPRSEECSDFRAAHTRDLPRCSRSRVRGASGCGPRTAALPLRAETAQRHRRASDSGGSARTYGRASPRAPPGAGGSRGRARG